MLDNESLASSSRRPSTGFDSSSPIADYVAAFDETRANFERFFNDADNDGWSIDGRSGTNRDWPYDGNGNDPDGWTAQMVITVTRR